MANFAACVPASAGVRYERAVGVTRAISSAIIRGQPGTVAQLVEQGPFKALVLGSSPSRPTIN